MLRLAAVGEEGQRDNDQEEDANADVGREQDHAATSSKGQTSVTLKP